MNKRDKSKLDGFVFLSIKFMIRYFKNFVILKFLKKISCFQVVAAEIKHKKWTYFRFATLKPISIKIHKNSPIPMFSFRFGLQRSFKRFIEFLIDFLIKAAIILINNNTKKTTHSRLRG